VHNFNKTAKVACDYYKKHEDRLNVILLGDSLGDCKMVDGAHYENVLKIGFLGHKQEGRLKVYMDKYDIVLIDDQTMNLPLDILKFICER